MFSTLSPLRQRSSLWLLALTFLATALLVGCGSQRGASQGGKFRWSDTSPAWSPDGRLIVFSSDRPDNKQWDLYVVDIGGNHPRRVTYDKLHEEDPVFVSKRRIVFTVRGKRYVIRTDGRGRTRRFQSKRTRPRPASFVAFARTGADGFDNIYVMRREGSAKRLVATDVVPISTLDFVPHWSPDRRMFAFDGVINRGAQIYVVRASSGSAKQVSHDPGVCCPAWSPDGKELAWADDGVTVARANGADSHRLAGREELGIAVVTWPKTGRRLLLTGNDGTYVVNLNRTGLRRLVKTPNVKVILSPDQTRAAFEEEGGPTICPGYGISSCYPRYSRIDVFDLSSGELRHLTQKRAR
jgi:Tol biopolymer transport system component